MAANTNPKTGVPYATIKADSLDSDLVHDLMYKHGKDISYQVAETEYIANLRQEWQAKVDERQEEIDTLEQREFSDVGLSDEDQARLRELQGARMADQEMPFDPEQVDMQPFADSYQCDEPRIEGIFENVHYGTSWLGGALLFYCFQSPYITHKAAQCSPCVPGAGDLDSLGHFTSYTFPPEWFSENYLLHLFQTEGYDLVEKSDGTGWFYYHLDGGFAIQESEGVRFPTSEAAALACCKANSLIGAGPFPVPTTEGESDAQT